jgi:hypothetical protein
MVLHTVGKKRNWHKRWHYCCDTCAGRMFSSTILKNLSLGVAAGVMTWQKLRSLRGRNPAYKELTEANRFAQDGNWEEAHLRYGKLIFHNEGHPGLHMNYGLASMRQGDMVHAAIQFKRALSVCANYEPVLNIMERHISLKNIQTPDDKKG